MKKILFTLCSILCLLFLSRVVFAQTLPSTGQASSPSGQTTSPTPSVHLAFPIAQLGNCTSASDCKAYCDDPTHISACIDYAKRKGFYHESLIDTQQTAILADAATSLGCNNVNSCKTFCADSANADACSAFAKKHNLQGGNETLNNTTLEKAKEVLGCDGVDSCRAFCDNIQNKDKCAAFARNNGLKGGNEKLGPGGCTSESSCKIFCSDPNNFQLCQRFTLSHSGSGSGQRKFVGPGGCTTEDSCRAFCIQNAAACHQIDLSSGTARPTGPLPTGFHVDNAIPTTMSPQDYCRINPDRCAGPTSTFSPTRSTSLGSLTPTPNYELYCESKGPGCTFTGVACACPTPTQNTFNGPTPTRSTSLGSLTPTPTPIQPTGTVQGIATQKNLFQWVIDAFFHVH